MGIFGDITLRSHVDRDPTNITSRQTRPVLKFVILALQNDYPYLSATTTLVAQNPDNQFKKKKGGLASVKISVCV